MKRSGPAPFFAERFLFLFYISNSFLLPLHLSIFNYQCLADVIGTKLRHCFLSLFGQNTGIMNPLWQSHHSVYREDRVRAQWDPAVHAAAAAWSQRAGKLPARD